MPRFSSEGSLAEVFIAFMDITSLKRAEERLRYQAELLDKVSDAVIATDLRLHVTSWNKGAERIYGWKAEEALGRNLDELLDTELINTNKQAAWESVDTKGYVELEVINKYRHGSRLFVQAHSVLLKDEQGNPTGTIGIIRDITGPRRAAEALRASEERLSLFVEHAPAALAMFDTQMRYLHVSRRWKTDFGLGDRDLSGVSHYEVFPGIPEAWKESHRRGLSGEFSSSEADRFERPDGCLRWIRWEVRPWYAAQGEVGGVLIFTEDITAEKRANEALQLQSEQLRALAARLQRVRDDERTTVARDLHDQLGQILTAINMDVTWVARRLPGTQTEVRDRLTQTIQLISDGVRSVRRICSGLRPGLLDDLGLAAAIEWQANEFSARTGICCNVSVPSEDLDLNSDSVTAIFRVFQEALTNVARHADAHGVNAFLGKQDDSLVLIVEDDGNGFCESEATDSLGLLGMRERAQACGGDVQISSSPGNGTTVTMCTPLHPSAG
jgi:PAS domain S-box-containing protein